MASWTRPIFSAQPSNPVSSFQSNFFPMLFNSVSLSSGPSTKRVPLSRECHMSHLASMHRCTWPRCLESSHTSLQLFKPMQHTNSVFIVLHSITTASSKTNPNGNILCLNPKFGDHVYMEYDIGWLSSSADMNAHAMAIDITQLIDNHAGKEYKDVDNTNYNAGN